MPSLNFEKQFVPLIESGQKRQTIRVERKNPIKVGDKLYLFSGLRTKYCYRIFTENLPYLPPFVKIHFINADNLDHPRLIRNFEEMSECSELRMIPYVICKSVEKIKIKSTEFIKYETMQTGEIMEVGFANPNSLNNFAQKDGFANWKDLIDFFDKKYGLPFVGTLIKW